MNDSANDSISLLYVDANPELADLTTAGLTEGSEQFTVDTANSASNGLEKLDIRTYDCIVSEYDLPDWDGLEFLVELRDQNLDIPFILFTGSGNELIASEAISAGVTDYLSKEAGSDPFVQLANSIQDAVEGHQATNRNVDVEREHDRRKALFEKFPDPSFAYAFEDDEPYITRINEAFTETFGYDTDEAVGEHVHDLLVRPDDRERAQRLSARVQAGEPVDTVISRQTADGMREFWFRNISMPDDPFGIDGYAIYVDRTDREERRRELERYKTVIQASGDPVYTLNADGHFTVVNDAFCEMTGYDEEQLAGAHFASLLTRSDRHRGEEIVRSLWDSDIERRTSELTIVRRDGTRIPCEIHITPLPASGPDESRGNVGVIRDISERNEREQQLRQQREQLQQREAKLIDLRDYTQDLMYAETIAETVDIALQAIADILGFELAAVFTPSASNDGVLDPVAVQDRERMTELCGGLPIFDRDESDGSLAALAWDVFESRESVQIDDTVSSGAVSTDAPFGSFTLYPIGGHGVVLVGGTAQAAFTDTEKLLLDLLANTLTTALDRLDRETELRRQRDELEQQNERLDAFTSVVSHDLRNPLSVLSQSIALIDHENDEHIDRCRRSIDRMEQLIDDLLTLAREGETESDPEPVNLRAVARSCWQTVESTGLELSVRTDLTIAADEGRLKQLLENIFRNAIEHGGDVDRLTIERIDDGFSVADNGGGIPSTERPKVFESGYSTMSEGTGLGLAIVEQIAKAHGWEVGIAESTSGGVRVEFTDVSIVR